MSALDRDAPNLDHSGNAPNNVAKVGARLRFSESRRIIVTGERIQSPVAFGAS